MRALTIRAKTTRMKALNISLILLALSGLLLACGDDVGDGNNTDGGEDAQMDAEKDSAPKQVWDGGGGCMNPEPPTPGECSGEHSLSIVLHRIETDPFERNESGDVIASEGFDLDCTAGLSCRCTNCSDVSNNAGDEGIDNQLSKFAGLLDTAFSITANIERAIKEGGLLLVLHLTGLDSPTLDETLDDDCVDVALVNGVVSDMGVPDLDENEELVSGQTFEVDSAFITDGVPNIRFVASIDRGNFSAGPATIPVTFPIADTSISLTIVDARLKASLQDGRLTEGLIGGVLDVDTLLSEIEKISEGASTPGHTVYNILRGFADAIPNEEDEGACSALSATLAFDTRAAELTGLNAEDPDGGADDGGPNDGGSSDAGVDAGQ